MIKFCSLFSGSSGNCIFIGTDRTRLLIDAGVSASRIERALREIGESPDRIDAVLITHEHSDHTSGAGIFARKYHTGVCANPETWSAMAADVGALHTEQQMIRMENDLEIGDIQIHRFAIPHDAASPVAYTFYIDDRKITVATDIGCVTEEVRGNLHGSDAVLLESNHDTEMLRRGSYPWPLKKRILSDHGHLCNDAAAALTAELAADGTKSFFLGHLSRENNRPELAFEAAKQQLSEQGFSLFPGSGSISSELFGLAAPLVHLSVAPRDGRSEVVYL